MRIHSPQFTGSVSITGSLTITGGLPNNFTSSNAVTASYAITASYVANASSFPFTGSAGITGSLNIVGSVTSTVGFTGSLSGSATTASYVLTAQTASYVLTAQTASYVLQAVSASFATTASYVLTAQTASYVLTAQTASYVLTAQTASYVKTAQTASLTLTTVTGTNSAELVRGNMADNDQFRILVGGTATNAGFVEIATADDGSEPIYARQYTGVFTTLARTATLLDGSGNTLFPNSLATNFTASAYHVTFRPTANVTFNIGQTTGNGATAGPFVNTTVNGVSDTTTVPLFFNCTSFHVFLGYSEAMRLTSGGALYIGSTITQNYSSWSDRKLKENLKIIANPLDKISKLTGYTFEWTKDSPYRNTPIVNRIQDAGLIAQDVEEVLPEIVRTTKENFKTVNYDGIIGLHTEGIKELIKQNIELLERIKQLEEKLL
jgi:hypothetical protein